MWIVILLLLMLPTGEQVPVAQGRRVDADRQTPGRDVRRAIRKPPGLTREPRPGFPREKLHGRWVGQDGTDRVGPRSEPGPSDVQDIHLTLDGIPPGRSIAWVLIRGLGADEWQYNGSPGPWRAEIDHEPGSRTADIYIEPARVEKGRRFDLIVRYNDRTETSLSIEGKAASPMLRPPGVKMEASWLGWSLEDRVGNQTAVGPDGLPDARIALRGLSTRSPIEAVAIIGPFDLRWESGVNPHGYPHAELSHESQAGHWMLSFQPDPRLEGRNVRVWVRYREGLVDSTELTVGRMSPSLSLPIEPIEEPSSLEVNSQWLGQESPGGKQGGLVGVRVSGIPAGRTIVEAALGDGVRGAWRMWEEARTPGSSEPRASDLHVRETGRPGEVELWFTPYRDLTGSRLALWTRLDDRMTCLASFSGGPCDLALRSERPSVTQTRLKPGDDIQEMVRKFGTVQLKSGEYRLDRPLVLDRPVRVVGEPGTRLVFSQRSESAAWTTAIKIHRGNTSLENLTIRFEGSIRWDEKVSYGPAVIGSTDERDTAFHEPKANVSLIGLDLECPESTGKEAWNEAMRLVRFMNVHGGRIAGNSLRGGMVEFERGPWIIEDNVSRGCLPGTYSHAVFAGHHTSDLQLQRNRVQPASNSGKTWRFLVLTGSGVNDTIADNAIEGIGPRELDTIPSMNAPEVFLTEAYKLKFEGRPSLIAPGGRFVRIPRPQGDAVQPGDAVAILAGPGVGTFRRVVLRIEPTLLLLDEPISPSVEAISIASGFIDTRFERNRVDVRGSSSAIPIVLVGNHFGTQVRGNQLLGGKMPFKLTAAPTEQPVRWGWSHAPFLMGLIEDNQWSGAIEPGRIAVEHSAAIQSNRGRTYLSIQIGHNDSGNRESVSTDRRHALQLGEPGCLDPGELLALPYARRGAADRLSKEPFWVRVERATVSDRPVTSRTISWGQEASGRDR